MRKLFTSESVTSGHPDKICDQISDAILDAMLEQDPDARVAVETAVTTGQVHVMGEVTTSAYVDIPGIVRKVILDIGYDSSEKFFDGKLVGVNVAIGAQSPDIAQGVGTSHEIREKDVLLDPYDTQGAGDQGLMFGFATNETPAYMPLPIFLSHRLAEQLEYERKSGNIDYLRPDGKTQVTVIYEDDVPVGIDTIVVSTQHDPDVTQEQIKRDIEEVILNVLRRYTPDFNYPARILVNPTGIFVAGGPHADAGLTGRKIIVDTYGGYARHGGGAFSGKDPSKVDRSAAYAARWAALHVVASGLAERCEIQLAYAIGVARPVSVYVNTFGTGKLDDEFLGAVINDLFDFRPAAIIHDLGLKAPIYQRAAAYGHFGRPGFPWETVNADKVRGLQQALELRTHRQAREAVQSLDAGTY